MRKLFISLMLFASPAAASDILTIPGLAGLMADKAKESKACALISLNGKMAAGAYLPVWTFHARDNPGDPAAQYFEVGLGGSIQQKENLRPLLTLDANLPALSGRLWSSAWAKSHLRRTSLPPIWFGPQFRTPFPGDKFMWRAWREWAGFIVSMGF